jgi:hypothetical protein
VFVFDALLEYKVSATIGAECQNVLVILGILDAIIKHLYQHSGIVSERELQTVMSLGFLKLILVDPNTN